MKKIQKEEKKPEAKIVRIADYRAKKNIIRLEDVKLKPIA